MANEKRLIDANEMKNNIMEAMMRQFEKNGDQIALRIAEMMWHFIDETDTVDAVEVKHGQWFVIEDDYFDLVELKCSACGESWGFEDYEDCIPQNYHYCPNCGAKMDGGVQNA